MIIAVLVVIAVELLKISIMRGAEDTAECTDYITNEII